METPGFCCGQIPKQKKIVSLKKLPDNPVVRVGVEVIYIGAGIMKVNARTSGHTYYFSDHQRRVKVETDDVAGIIKTGTFIIKP
jgi:hypothetical protein